MRPPDFIRLRRGPTNADRAGTFNPVRESGELARLAGRTTRCAAELTDLGRETVNDVGGVCRDLSFDDHRGDEPIDEFVHVPLTIPALRRVAIILNGAAAEHKWL